jgi:hypothetical protein
MIYLENIGNQAGKITTTNEPFYFNMITCFSLARKSKSFSNNDIVTIFDIINEQKLIMKIAGN